MQYFSSQGEFVHKNTIDNNKCLAQEKEKMDHHNQSVINNTLLVNEYPIYLSNLKQYTLKIQFDLVVEDKIKH